MKINQIMYSAWIKNLRLQVNQNKQQHGTERQLRRIVRQRQEDSRQSPGLQREVHG
jgi:hypothetical protein